MLASGYELQGNQGVLTCSPYAVVFFWGGAAFRNPELGKSAKYIFCRDPK